MVATIHMWLLSTWKVFCITKELSILLNISCSYWEAYQSSPREDTYIVWLIGALEIAQFIWLIDALKSEI
jgi:hypothetical protein